MKKLDFVSLSRETTEPRLATPRVKTSQYCTDKVHLVEEVRSLKSYFGLSYKHENVLQKYIWLLNLRDINNYEFCH